MTEPVVSTTMKNLCTLANPTSGSARVAGLNVPGLSSLASRGMPPGVDFRTFIYPGVLSMSVLFTAIFSAASIVWDREFGFLR